MSDKPIIRLEIQIDGYSTGRDATGHIVGKVLAAIAAITGSSVKSVECPTAQSKEGEQDG